MENGWKKIPCIEQSWNLTIKIVEKSRNFGVRWLFRCQYHSNFSCSLHLLDKTRGPLVLYRSPECWGYAELEQTWKYKSSQCCVSCHPDGSIRNTFDPVIKMVKVNRGPSFEKAPGHGYTTTWYKFWQHFKAFIITIILYHFQRNPIFLIISSSEPKAHKVSLKYTNGPSSVGPWSSTLSNLNISEASWLILIKFYVQHHWGGGKAA